MTLTMAFLIQIAGPLAPAPAPAAAPLPSAASPLAASVPPAPAASPYGRLPMRSCGEHVMEPRQAIERAADLAPAGGVAACFRIVVRAAGDDGHGNLFLDSEEDHRDQRSLNIRLSPGAAASLRELLGTQAVLGALRGRTLLVRGEAFRTRIDFVGGGQPTGKYYYQTQVPVGDVRQLARPLPE